MAPTDVLAGEHRIIEQVLACLAKMVPAAFQAGRLDKQSALDAVTFFRLFADRCHLAKEETYLFPALEAGGFPRDAGPTGVLLGEHEAARAHVHAMDDALETAAAGDAQALQQFADHALSLIALLREHIRKEDHCLFAMFNQVVGKKTQEALTAAFGKLDAEPISSPTRQAGIEIANRLADRFGMARAETQLTTEHRPCHCWLYSELAEKKRIVDKQNLVMTRDLDLARQVQHALIPRKTFRVRGLEIAFDYEPAIQVGGDLLDVIPVGGDRVLLFVGDVVGHGVKAALAMAAVKAAVLAVVKSDPRPGYVLRSINDVVREMFADSAIPQFVTAVCCLVDPPKAQAELALAGHPRPFWYRALAVEIVQEGEGNLPLGIDQSSRYPETSILLEPQDVLVLYTDGLVEAFDPGDRLYGYQRFRELVLHRAGSSAGELVTAIKSDLEAHRGGRALADDVALLVVKFAGVGAETEVAGSLSGVSAAAHSDYS